MEAPIAGLVLPGFWMAAAERGARGRAARFDSASGALLGRFAGRALRPLRSNKGARAQRPCSAAPGCDSGRPGARRRGGSVESAREHAPRRQQAVCQFAGLSRDNLSAFLFLFQSSSALPFTAGNEACRQRLLPRRQPEGLLWECAEYNKASNQQNTHTSIRKKCLTPTFPTLFFGGERLLQTLSQVPPPGKVKKNECMQVLCRQMQEN